MIFFQICSFAWYGAVSFKNALKKTRLQDNYFSESVIGRVGAGWLIGWLPFAAISTRTVPTTGHLEYA